MHSTEQRRLAIETFIRFGHSYADTIAELGYPDRHTLNSWWREYRETGEVPVGKMIREPRFSDDQKREAVEHYLGHGKSLSRTMRALGYPKGSGTLRWPVSTSPDAEMASPSLLGACKWLGEGDHPKIRSDRGCHCRWPGWTRICDEDGLARSMPGKGCSPGSARCEDFFGRLKIEFFHGCDWAGIAGAPCSTAGTWVC